MGKFYLSIFISFIILFFVHIIFFIINLFFWITDGVNVLIDGGNLIENIYYSKYLKWLILLDAMWIVVASVFAFKRKSYKTNSELHYLQNNEEIKPNVCMVIPTYNEEKNIESLVQEFFAQDFVKNIIVVDNNSSDKTVEIAKNAGAMVIAKKINKGHTDSCMIGFKESLKTNSNIIGFTDADGTFSPKDLRKMIPYLENSDMVLGTRQVQILTEKGNQNSMFYVWGNLFLAKLLQIKYFSLKHLGTVSLTDVGCAMRLIRRDCLEKIIPLLSDKDSEYPHAGDSIQLHITMLAIENNLRLVEIPITFKKRIGKSKLESNELAKGIKWGFKFMWFILKS